MSAAEPWSAKPLATTVAPTDDILMSVGGVNKRGRPQQILDASSIWRSKQSVVVGTRSARWAVRENYTSVTCGTSRTRHRVKDDVKNIRVMYSGMKSLGSFATPSEVGLGNRIEVMAALHIISSGTTVIAKLPFKFCGGYSGVIPNGGYLVSDPISVKLPAGTEFFIHSFGNRLTSAAYTNQWGEPGRLAATGANWPREDNTRTENTAGAWEAGVGTEFSASTGIDPFTLDKTMADYSGLTVANVLTFAPSAIFGDRLTTNGQPSVAWVGDSILAGTGDLARADVSFSGRGYSDQFLSGQCPGFNASLGGDGAAYKVGQYLFNFANRWAGVELCEVAYVALGTNDLIAGTALATIQANLVDFANQLKARGVRKVILATVLPRTTSTDGWQTLGNQTVVATSDFTNQRALFNAWALTVPAPFDAVLDIRSGVEDIATGKWKEPPVGADLTTTTGSTSTVIQLNSSVTAGQHIGKQLVMGGEVRQVISNTTTAITVVSAFGSTPGSGVALKVVDTYTADGTHPSAWGHKGLGSVLNANASVFAI